jgi:methylated-DNA-[protein]-cysteine S-methyltransferase
MTGGKMKAMPSQIDRRRCALSFDTAWGRSCLIYSPEPFLIFSLALPGTKNDFRPDSEKGSKAAHPRAIQVGRAIAAFFEGHPPAAIPEAWLALEQLTPNERTVLRVVEKIPYGATRTYAQVAGMAGFPGGARFAGNALHKNPFPVIIPCHRVVRSDGSIGGFAGGCEMKKKMIALEAAVLQKGSRLQGGKGIKG